MASAKNNFKVIGSTDGIQYEVGTANTLEAANNLAAREVHLNIECDYVSVVAV